MGATNIPGTGSYELGTTNRTEQSGHYTVCKRVVSCCVGAGVQQNCQCLASASNDLNPDLHLTQHMNHVHGVCTAMLQATTIVQHSRVCKTQLFHLPGDLLNTKMPIDSRS